MQNNLTTLHQQFQRKHLELSQITSKIQNYMQNYRSKCDEKRVLRNSVKFINQDIKNLKSQFNILKEDLVTYSQLPNQFIRMVIQLPRLYENYWENRQQDLARNLRVKQQQCKMLQEKLFTNNQQNKQLKTKLQILQAKIEYFCKTQKHSKNQNEQKNKKIPHQTKNKGMQQKLQEKDEIDQYIDNMEITIRQNEDPLFKKITEQGSQQEQQEDSNFQHFQKFENRNSLRAHQFILDQLNDSKENTKNEQDRKMSQASILDQKQRNRISNLNKTEQIVIKNNFWRNLSKNIKQTKQLKSKSKKCLSQSKQNLQGKQQSKLSHMEKKILTSKITDFRRLLFAEKGYQKFSFKN